MLARQLHEMGVRVDAMDTVSCLTCQAWGATQLQDWMDLGESAPCTCPAQVNAVATFNVLNQESRQVVGAFLPHGVES